MKEIKNINIKSKPALRQTCVIASLSSAFCKLFCRQEVPKPYKNGINEAFNKVYTIVNPDEYDKQYGLLIEIGQMSVEEYYYIKGHYFGQKTIDEKVNDKTYRSIYTEPKSFVKSFECHLLPPLLRESFLSNLFQPPK